MRRVVCACVFVCVFLHACVRRCLCLRKVRCVRVCVCMRRVVCVPPPPPPQNSGLGSVTFFRGRAGECITVTRTLVDPTSHPPAGDIKLQYAGNDHDAPILSG